MISIVSKDRGDCPVVICDHCGKPIQDARDGNAEWAMGLYPLPVRFTHKRCCHPFESLHGGGGQWLTADLDVWLVYLLNGLRFDRKTAEAKAALLDRI